MRNQKLKKLTIISVMAAISTIIYLILPEIPLVPGSAHLKLDFSDIPAVVTGIIVGPISGVCVEVIKNILHLFRTTTVGIGEIMNTAVGAAMVVSVAMFSKLFAKIFKKDRMHFLCYIVSSVLAIIVTIIVGWASNALLTPVFFKLAGIPCTAAAVFAGVWGSTLLNAIKASLNLILFYPLYYAAYYAYGKIRD